MHAQDILSHFGVTARSGEHVVRSPIDGAEIGRVDFDRPESIEAKIAASAEAFRVWRDVPAPRRGELVRLFGEELRAHKQALARLVSLENGKILQEGLGEVQEMIDICDFAVGLSRQLYGLTIASERPGHRMMEQWHPAGPVVVISAFNFPVAVWAWNAALALVCGDLEAVGENAAHGARHPGVVCARGREISSRAARAVTNHLGFARRGRGVGA
jgi:aldehyde dehydrogenase (NAD+)